MRYNSPFHEFFASCRRVGFFNSLRLAYARFYDLTFDYRYNVDTASRAELEDLNVDQERAKRGQMYQPTGVMAFNSIMKRVTLPESSVLIDYGCGKGRVLLMAARLKKVVKAIGVDFSQELCDAAEINIANFKKYAKLDKDISVVCCDATKYEYTGEENVFYFFYPFDAELMERVIAGIEASLKEKPREAVLVYYLPFELPQERAVVEESGVFELENEFKTFAYDCLIFRHQPGESS